MCNFFSFVTDPDNHPGERFYYNATTRAQNFGMDYMDSHSRICTLYHLNEDTCNKYEYNPITKDLDQDDLNAEIDDIAQVSEWVSSLDFSKVEPNLIIKPFIGFSNMPAVKHVTAEQIEWLKAWAALSVNWNTLDESSDFYMRVITPIRKAVGRSLADDLQREIVRGVLESGFSVTEDAVGADLYRDQHYYNSFYAARLAYFSTFFKAEYRYDFSPLVKLWESGILPIQNKRSWLLISGNKVIFKMSATRLMRS